MRYATGSFDWPLSGGGRDGGVRPGSVPGSVGCVAAAQVKPRITAIQRNKGLWDRVPELEHPVLVANGAHDVLIHAYASYAMSQRLPNGKIILYSDACHGFVFQHYGTSRARSPTTCAVSSTQPRSDAVTEEYASLMAGWVADGYGGAEDANHLGLYAEEIGLTGEQLGNLSQAFTRVSRSGPRSTSTVNSAGTVTGESSDTLAKTNMRRSRT